MPLLLPSKNEIPKQSRIGSARCSIEALSIHPYTAGRKPSKNEC